MTNGPCLRHAFQKISAANLRILPAHARPRESGQRHVEHARKEDPAHRADTEVLAFHHLQMFDGSADENVAKLRDAVLKRLTAPPEAPKP